MMMMMSNEDGVTITTHFSQRFESDCTVLSPSGFVKGQQGPSGASAHKKNAEEGGASLLVSTPTLN